MKARRAQGQPADDHRAQGRPPPADHHRGGRGQDPRLQLPPRAGEHRSQRRPDDRGRPPARQTPAKWPARRTSPAACRGSPSSSRPVVPRTPPSSPRLPAGSSCSRRIAAARGRSTSGTRPASRSEHLVLHDKYLRVHGGDWVEAGDPLIEGPMIPHDILRIWAKSAPSVSPPRDPERLPLARVEIDDKHLEIIIAQMLRKVRSTASATRTCCRARSSTSSSSAGPTSSS